MASTKAYLEYIMEQLSQGEEVTCRPMMGEYVIYYRDKVIGGVYDDRFLVKPTKSALAMMPHAPHELPYEGAKPMLLADNIEDRAFMAALLQAMYDELPRPSPRKSRS